MTLLSLFESVSYDNHMVLAEFLPGGDCMVLAQTSQHLRETYLQSSYKTIHVLQDIDRPCKIKSSYHCVRPHHDDIGHSRFTKMLNTHFGTLNSIPEEFEVRKAISKPSLKSITDSVCHMSDPHRAYPPEPFHRLELKATSPFYRDKSTALRQIPFNVFQNPGLYKMWYKPELVQHVFIAPGQNLELRFRLSWLALNPPLLINANINPLTESDMRSMTSLYRRLRNLVIHQDDTSPKYLQNPRFKFYNPAKNEFPALSFDSLEYEELQKHCDNNLLSNDYTSLLRLQRTLQRSASPLLICITNISIAFSDDGYKNQLKIFQNLDKFVHLRHLVTLHYIKLFDLSQSSLNVIQETPTRLLNLKSWEVSCSIDNKEIKYIHGQICFDKPIYFKLNLIDPFTTRFQYHGERHPGVSGENYSQPVNVLNHFNFAPGSAVSIEHHHLHHLAPVVTCPNSFAAVKRFFFDVVQLDNWQHKPANILAFFEALPNVETLSAVPHSACFNLRNTKNLSLLFKQLHETCFDFVQDPNRNVPLDKAEILVNVVEKVFPYHDKDIDSKLTVTDYDKLTNLMVEMFINPLKAIEMWEDIDIGIESHLHKPLRELIWLLLLPNMISKSFKKLETVEISGNISFEYVYWYHQLILSHCKQLKTFFYFSSLFSTSSRLVNIEVKDNTFPKAKTLVARNIPTDLTSEFETRALKEIGRYATFVHFQNDATFDLSARVGWAIDVEGLNKKHAVECRNHGFDEKKYFDCFSTINYRYRV